MTLSVRDKTRASLGRCVAVIVAGVLATTGLSSAAKGADRDASGSATITVEAIGRDGHPAAVGSDAVAVPLFGAPLAQYRSDSDGVLTVPPGKYLLTVDITTSASTGTSGTLAARIVTVRDQATVHFDARKGIPLVLHFSQPGVRSGVAAAGLCYGTGPPAQPVISDGEAFENGSTAIYAIPFNYKKMSFGYTATWYDSSDTPYITSGNTAGGIPAKPNYSFKLSELAKLRLQVTGGTEGGTNGSWSVNQVTGCWFGELFGRKLIAIPSRRSLYVSAAPWQVRFSPNDGTGESTTQVNIQPRAGRSYVQKLDAAVVAPANGIFPQYAAAGRGYFSMPLNSFFSGTDGGLLCCADGVLRLSTQGRVVKVDTFTKDKADFAARLRRTGWYNLKVSVERAAPRPGFTGPTLSLSEVLAWRFKVTSTDLGTVGARVPVAVVTFVAVGLNADNEAAPSARTGLRMRVWAARHGGAFRLRTVRLSASFNGGKRWRFVSLVRHGSYWLAEIPDPATGFVSLRATVTDVQGDATVETVHRAYGVEPIRGLHQALPDR